MKEAVAITMLIISFVAIGWCGDELYRAINYKRMFNGLYLQGYGNYTDALQKSYEYDSMGKWICINVRGMDFNEAVSTCNHEAGHEIFANIIQEHPEKINQVMEIVQNES